MYPVDERDVVSGDLDGVPQSCTGAPSPCILSDERTLVLAYSFQEPEPEFDPKRIPLVGPNPVREPVALIRFQSYIAYMFGPPNDEAFSGHPLASRGLGPYSAVEVFDSSWVRQLERMNSVHRRHNPERFKVYRHFIFAFHDSTFECIAKNFDLNLRNGTRESILPEIQKMLKWIS